LLKITSKENCQKIFGLSLNPRAQRKSPNMHPNMPNMAKYAKYAYLGAYLGARNMVKWGVPEKILQNAVQTRWS